MSTKTLSEQRQWFLDAALTTTIPLMGLLDKNIFYDDGDLQNMPFHDFDEATIISIIAGLCGEELIEVIDYEIRFDLDEDIVRVRPSPSISGATVEALLHIEIAEGENMWEKMSYYRLTSKGGAYWEDLAQPNWNDYVKSHVVGPIFSLGEDENISIRGGWERSIEGLNEDTIREAIQRPPLGAFPSGDKEWSVLTPWEATYWKTFPQAHRVLYPCTDALNFHSLNKMREIEENERYKVLYLRHWYQSPWR